MKWRNNNDNDKNNNNSNNANNNNKVDNENHNWKLNKNIKTSKCDRKSSNNVLMERKNYIMWISKAKCNKFFKKVNKMKVIVGAYLSRIF